MNLETISDPEKNEDIHYINFNQDFSCFMVGTNNDNSNCSSTDSLNKPTNLNNNQPINNKNTKKNNTTTSSPNKRNSLTNSFKNLTLKNGSFQQKIKTNSIVEARKNLMKRSSIKNMNNNNYNNNSNNNPTTTTTTTTTTTPTTPKETKPIQPTLTNCPGLIIVEGLYHSNLLAIVGKDISSDFSPNKVILCDMSSDSIIAEIQYEVEVKAVRLTEYGHGITVVLPGKTQGEIQILNLQYKENISRNDRLGRPIPSTTGTPTPKTSIIPTFSKIRAHKSTLSCLSISLNGELVASASEQGTIIRIFNLETRQKMHEFRRGTDKAQIYCINFNRNANKICVSSNKGTIHIFNLDDDYSMMVWQQQQQWNNELDRNSTGYPDGYSTTTMTHYDKKQQQQQAPLSIYSISQKIVPKYFIERSWAQFRLPLSNICTFIDTFANQSSDIIEKEQKELQQQQPNKVELIALCSNGYLYRFTCITTIKASSSSFTSMNNNINENIEDEDEEDNDIIENFYNEDYVESIETS
ncbi:hypothetical protein PIROE2DRAFT_19710, partial [Piromyces sp. E2]